MRVVILVLLAALFCSCEESKYYIHVANNTADPDREEPGQTVRYALAKDSETIHAIAPGEEAVHEVAFGVPHGIGFYEEGKPRNIGVRYTGDDSYEFYTMRGIPFSVINTLNFDAELSCDGYLSEEPLPVPKQGNSVPGKAKGRKIYTQTPNFKAVFKDGDAQEHAALVTFTVQYDDDDQAEGVTAEIR
ncbi:MAG: hypothetical protein LBU18_00385 [Treponema sp.]|jgi:hypothetical protein|nr:hypothetical protein [Treponema sp.]